MEDKILQQISNTLERAQRIAIVLPQSISIDLAATAQALQLILNNLGKSAVIATTGALPKGLNFLNPDIELTNILSMAGPEQLITSNLEIVVPQEESSLSELSYEVKQNNLHIFLHAQAGGFDKSSVKVLEPQIKPELLILLGAQSFEGFGDIYQSSAEMFFETPKLVIDNNPENTYFGTINLIDISAVSVGEIVADWLLTSYSNEIQPNIATALLGAITSATQSFQSARTTPRVFALASDLVNKGADQQLVVRSLYKTKSFGLLKLWGRALARAHELEGYGLLYSTLSNQDYEKTLTDESLAQAVLEEFLDQAAGVQIVALFAQQDQNTNLLLASLPHINIEKIAEGLSINNNKLGTHGLYVVNSFLFNEISLEQAQEAFISVLRQTV